MQATNIPATKKAAPKKRAPKRPTAEHDFDAYRNWAREAFADETILSDQDIAENWASLSNEYKADFVTATREFKDAEQARAAPNTRLIDALKVVLALSDPDGGNRASTRVLAASAKRHHEALTEALKLREAATADISSHLDALDEVLQTRPGGRFEQYLKDHQQHLRATYNAELNHDNDWLGSCAGFRNAKWTSDEVKSFKDLAQGIKNSLEPPHPPSDRDTSSQKRKRQSNQDDAGSEAARANEAPVARKSKSARGGASSPPQPDATVSDDQEGNREQGGQLQPPGQQLGGPPAFGGLPAAPIGGLPAALLGMTGNSGREGGIDGPDVQLQMTEENAAPELEPLPLPTIGNIGPNIHALRNEQARLPPKFVTWCRHQLINDRDRSPEAVEMLVEGFFTMFYQVLVDHDWENEGGVPFVPFIATDLQHNWPAGRHWPNVRRLHEMTENASDDCKEYVKRHLYNGKAVRADANHHAFNIILRIQKHGLHQDWDQVDDRFITRQELDHTKTKDLQGLNGGYWQVSFSCEAI